MKLLKPIITLGAILAAGICSATVSTENLRCEYLNNPLGIDSTSPRLSWILSSPERGELQSAYQILVASSEQLLAADTGDLWDSGKVAASDTAQIAYGGQPLISRERCFWKVRVWDAAGTASEWSSVEQWQMGLLQPSDWQAKWISPGAQIETPSSPVTILLATYHGVDGGGTSDVTAAVTSKLVDGRLNLLVNNKTLGVDPALNVVKRLHVEYVYEGQTIKKDIDENQTLRLPDVATPLPYLRKSFELKSPVVRATLLATALGLYEVHINGQRVGDHVLAPDWTDYRKRVRYQMYDVTSLLQPGQNALGAFLAKGWYSGHIGNGGFEFFGKQPAFLAQLEVTFADGTTQTIVTDDSWKSHDSPILASDFMLGEDYDSRLELAGWDQRGL